jgi:hypothetical protein
VEYIESLREYWLARGDIEQLLSGRVPALVAMPMGAGRGSNMNGTGGH